MVDYGVDPDRVLVGTPDQSKTTGAIMSAPVGTPLPTNIGDEIDPAFQGSGYVSSDGLTLTPDISTSDINDWSGNLVRRVLESFAGTIAWSYIQTGIPELQAAFGADNVTSTPADTSHGERIRVSVGARLPEHKAWIFKMKDEDRAMMVVAPDAQVTSMDDITFTATDPISWPITLSCYPDDDGNVMYLLFDDGKVQAVPAKAVESIAMNPTTLSVQETKTGKLAVNFTPSDATDRTVTWATDNDQTATVDQSGTVTGVKAGHCHVTATSEDGNKVAICDVTVTAQGS